MTAHPPNQPLVSGETREPLERRCAHEWKRHVETWPGGSDEYEACAKCGVVQDQTVIAEPIPTETREPEIPGREQVFTRTGLIRVMYDASTMDDYLARSETRVTRLEDALRGVSFGDMDDGSPCYCIVALAEGESDNEHEPHCVAARAALERKG